MSVKELAEQNIIKCLKCWYMLYGVEEQSRETFEHFKATFPNIQVWSSYFLDVDESGYFNITDKYKCSVDSWLN